jgi:hypothetical protein
MVKLQCRDVFTRLSGGREFRWFLQPDSVVMQERQMTMRDAQVAKEVFDRFDRLGRATEAERAEIRRFAIRAGAEELPVLEASYSKTTVPTIGPSLSAEQFIKLIR